MPRADPTRSDYCASRHLLRNLDNPKELRRNPLARVYFSGTTDASVPTRPRNVAADGATLERIRADVRVSLAGCGEFARSRTHVALGRIHAVLLRCEIDDRPPTEVAAEVGLSERQLRRERRTAHGAFACAFRTLHRTTPAPATICDVATVRLAEAVELHELGQGVLAQSAFASIAADAPSPERRIEALCLAAEAEFDALRHAAAAARLADARALMIRYERAFDDATARAADEHVDFIAWLLHWQTAISGGLATQPPLALAPGDDDRSRSEPRRALLVRAAAAYATQRWEVGDGACGRAVVRRAWDVMSTLHATRTKERLAIMMADAQLFGLAAPRGADRHRFSLVEQLAASRGHIHTMLGARAERIVSEAVAGSKATRHVFEDVLRPFGTLERREMARTFAWAAHAVTHAELSPRATVASAHLTESMVPARSMAALITRCTRANVAIDARNYDAARPLAQHVYDDAAALGNGWLRGAAARSLAAVAFGCRHRSEARRYIQEALTLTERFGSPSALANVNMLARRLDVA